MRVGIKSIRSEEGSDVLDDGGITIPMVMDSDSSKETLGKEEPRGSRIYRSSGDRLTVQQNQFVNEYLIDKNGRAAAVRAGYSAHTAQVQASRLLGTPAIQEMIRGKLKQLEEKTMLTAESVLKGIALIGEICMQREPVYDANGDVVGERMMDASNALRAQELLGKHLELFTDKVKQTGDVSVNVILHEENIGKISKDKTGG